MRVKILMLMLTSSFVLFGQSKNKKLIFSEYDHDFGYIKESDGKIHHQFKFVNKGSDSIRIISAKDNCNCISSEFSLDKVAPKDSGIVKVSFDPSNPINKEFKKSLIIRATNDTVTLTIKGHIIPKHRSQSPAVYSKHLGATWVRSNYVQMQYIYTDEVKQREFDVYNSSDSTLVLKFENLPKHVGVFPSGDTLEPKEVGDFTFTYNAGLKNDLSYVVDTFMLITNEDTLNKKIMFISANIGQRFEEGVDTINLPKVELIQQEVDFRTMRKSASKSDTFRLKNVGKDTLFVNKMIAPCSCIKLSSIESEGYVLPGAEYRILATFYSDKRKGNMKKPFYIYTNDPRQPISEFRIRVYINK